MEYNIYCDESCHLQNDGNDIMVLGAMSIPNDLKSSIFNDIRDIKLNHNLSSWLEIKWTKVSPAKIDFYKELIMYFFNNEYINFRCVVANGKTTLDHERFNNGDYDLWYYKMYFFLLDKIIYPTDRYRIYVDIKDTRGGPRVNKLRSVLCNNIYDFKQEIIQDVSQIHSHESEIMGLVDLFIGAVSYINRGLLTVDGSSAKTEIVNLVREHSGSSLTKSSRLSENKFNLFIWEARK